MAAISGRAQDDRTIEWVRAHLDLLRIAGVAVAVLLLIVISMSWVGFLVIAVLLAAYEFGLHRIGQSTPRSLRRQLRGLHRPDHPRNTHPPPPNPDPLRPYSLRHRHGNAVLGRSRERVHRDSYYFDAVSGVGVFDEAAASRPRGLRPRRRTSPCQCCHDPGRAARWTPWAVRPRHGPVLRSHAHRRRGGPPAPGLLVSVLPATEVRNYASTRITRVSGNTPSYAIASDAPALFMAPVKASMSATSVSTATCAGFCGSTKVRMLVTPRGQKDVLIMASSCSQSRKSFPRGRTALSGWATEGPQWRMDIERKEQVQWL